MKRTGLMAVVLAAAMAVACGDGARDVDNDNAAIDNAPAVGTGGEVADTRNDETRDVQEFVRDVAMHNTAEIELGRIAAERGQNAEVKRFGQMMVDEHTKAGAELKSAVAPHNVQVMEQMDDKHRDLAQRLRGLSGNEFDREYMSAMVDGHEQVKDLLEPHAEDANDGSAAPVEMAVNQWAAKTLPSVEKHLQQAEQLRDRVNDTRRQTQNTTTAPAR